MHAEMCACEDALSLEVCPEVGNGISVACPTTNCFRGWRLGLAQERQSTLESADNL
jgi:hypothetical protein